MNRRQMETAREIPPGRRNRAGTGEGRKNTEGDKEKKCSTNVGKKTFERQKRKKRGRFGKSPGDAGGKKSVVIDSSKGGSVGTGG